MTDTAPLTDEQLASIRYRGERPSQYTAATIRRDYADLLAALTAATERAARFEAAYDKVLSIAAAEAKEAYEVGRNAAQDEVARLRAELATARCGCYPHPADHETDCPRAAANGETPARDGWTLCSPEWLAAGGDCHNAPRRPAFDPQYSHEHPAVSDLSA